MSDNSTVIIRGSAIKDDVIQYDINWGPIPVRAGSEEFVERRSHRLNVGTGWVVIEIETFIGLDRGNVCEADFQVYDKRNRVLYRRSLHKEVAGNYEAFDHKVMYHDPEGEIYMDLAARGTEDAKVIRWHPAILITLEREEPVTSGEEIPLYFDNDELRPLYRKGVAAEKCACSGDKHAGKRDDHGWIKRTYVHAAGRG